MHLDIVFQNRDFIILDKPSGVLTTPSRFPGEDSRQCLGIELQKQVGVQVYPVHRLDFEVSGLVVFGLSANFHRVANQWFEKRLISKTYWARTSFQDLTLPYSLKERLDLAVGYEVQWQCRILRGKKRAFSSPSGKLSLTNAKIVRIDFTKEIIEWELMPLTGRPHQLRYELARHGFPIGGDLLYGSKVNGGENKIDLRAFRLELAPEVQSENNFGFPNSFEIPRNR